MDASAAIRTDDDIGEIISYGNFERFKSKLLENPDLVNARAGRRNVNAFNRACLEGQLEMARLLFDMGCDVCNTDNDKYNSAHLAAWYGREEILAFLIEACPKRLLTASSISGTPFDVALGREHLGCMSQLLEFTSRDERLRGLQLSIYRKRNALINFFVNCKCIVDRHTLKLASDRKVSQELYEQLCVLRNYHARLPILTVRNTIRNSVLI